MKIEAQKIAIKQMKIETQKSAIKKCKKMIESDGQITEKKERGITLIALVVTIIIMLILAGVALTMSLGENGLISQARFAKEKYENSENNETKVLNEMEKYIGRERNYVKDGLIYYLDGINEIDNKQADETAQWKNLASEDENATIHGATVSPEGYLNFDGINDWVNLGKINIGSGMTLQVTIQINEKQNGEIALMENYEKAGMGIQLMTGIPRTQICIQDKYYQWCDSDETLDPAKVYCITGMYDGTKLSLYVNEVFKSSIEINGTVVQSSAVMALGANPAGENATGQYANMKLYSARIYNKALSKEEINHNYELDKYRFGI